MKVMDAFQKIQKFKTLEKEYSEAIETLENDRYKSHINARAALSDKLKEVNKERLDLENKLSKIEVE